jgi:hypothetical protein
VEADLRRIYHCTTADLHAMGWVGRVRLLQYLPREAVLSGYDGWTQGDLLASDAIFVHTGKHHPDDPRVRIERERIEARMNVAKRRSEKRRARLGITGSVLRRKKG